MHFATSAGAPFLFLLLFVSTALGDEKKPDAAPTGVVKVRRAPFRHTVVADGVLVPAHATALSITPQAFTGKLRVQNVVAHGTAVTAGDVVLRLEDEALDAALRQAEWNVRKSELDLHAARETLEETERNLERDREKAEEDLAAARHTLDGYRDIQRPIDKRSYRRGEKSYIDNIEDQQDEIDQLGQMYAEDELTEATEELVLKRARRKLATTKERLEIYRARFRYNQEYVETKTLRTLERSVEDRERKLRQLEGKARTGLAQARIKVERTEHDHQASERKLERLREDAERFVLRAPHPGVVLHGNFVSGTGLQSEKVAARIVRPRDLVTARRTVLTIATPGAMKVRFALKAADRYEAKTGMAAAVLPEALPSAVLAATLESPGTFPQADGKWTAHALFAAADPRLVPLMKCTVRAVLVDLPDALVVPGKALFERGGRWYCHVRDSSPFGLSARAVVRGPSNEKQAVILEGLREGDEVLLPEKSS